MSKKYHVFSKRIARRLQAMIPFVALMAVQAATGIDETMPTAIPPEIIVDWESQDQASGHSTKAQLGEDIGKIAGKLPPGYALQLTNDSTKAGYYKACHLRRAARFKGYSGALQQILYSRHHDLGGPSVGYMEEMKSDSIYTGMGRYATAKWESGGGYAAGGALMLLTFKDCYPSPTPLLSDSIGCLRDPCVSFSGNKVLFAWSKDNNGYHIYEMIISKPDSIRQLTFDPAGLTVSDFDPCYLPNGDIVFSSSRCFGATPVGFNAVSNLYFMNKDGKYLRRIAYDMAHAFAPSLQMDGTILYSRWEFNDRNQYNCLGLFKMNIDGTKQIEMYGNQSTWPGAIYQGVEMPMSVGDNNTTGKIIAVIGGYNGSSANGDLAVINTLTDRNSPSAVQLIAPQRPNPTTFGAISTVADSCRRFQNPYPFDDTWFLISYRQNAATDKFKVYFMNVNGQRELLAWDSKQSVSQPKSCIARNYTKLAYETDWSKSTAQIEMLNAYYGMGMDTSIKRTDTVVRKIRVIGLDYRVPGSFGDVGGDKGKVITPVARWGGTLHAKRIIGESPVFGDGSAKFFAPARTPFYFQLIDSSGCAIQTMRSVLTVQPGEKYKCYGCHENKNESPMAVRPEALNAVPIDSFYGLMNASISFPKVIQPILTAKCAPCHIASDSGKLSLKGDTVWTGNLNDPVNKTACRFWCKSYLNLTDSAKGLVKLIPPNSGAEGIKPYTYGSAKSKLITRLRGGMHGATLTKAEMAKLCAWIDMGAPHGGKYNDDMLPADSIKYENRLKARLFNDSLERVNIGVFVSDSQYNNYTGALDRSVSRLLAGGAILKARYLMAGRRLWVKVPSDGMIALVDLRGRRVLTATVSKAEFLSRPEVMLPLRLPAGLYILKFKGAKNAAETTVPVL